MNPWTDKQLSVLTSVCVSALLSFLTSVCPRLCLSVFLSFLPTVCPYLCSSICPSFFSFYILYVHTTVYQSMDSSVHPSFFPTSVHLSGHPSICCLPSFLGLLMHLFICLFEQLFIYFFYFFT